MAITAELSGDLAIGRSVGVGSAEDEAAAEGQRLGRRGSAVERVQVAAVVVG
jgi:hypothetical protein